MGRYEELEAWRAADRLAVRTFLVSARWTRDQRFEFTSQVRRAALSVPTNIAEGSARQGRREFARFLGIAVASLAELRYLLRFGLETGLIESADATELEQLRDAAARLTGALHRAVRGN